MKSKIICTALAVVMGGFLVVGFANAGIGPRRSHAVSGGCASQQQYTMVAEATGGSCSQVMVAPAYKDCGCAGGRVTLAERATARRAARANYNKTFDACLAAAAKGELDVTEGATLQTMKMVPVESAPICNCGDECNCN